MPSARNFHDSLAAIVKLTERCIEMYTTLESGAYAHVEHCEPGQTIHPRAFADVSFAVSDILK